MSKASDRQPIVRRRLITAEELRKVREYPELAPYVGRDIPKNHPLLYYSAGAHLDLATTQPKKNLEMTLPLSLRLQNVTIGSPVDKLAWWLSAKEISRSYLGNASEKAESINDRVYNHIGVESHHAAVKRQGINPINHRFVVNDTGSSMSRDYSGEPEFDPSRYVVTSGSWPGVETAPIFDAQGGISNFHSALKNMKERFKKEGRLEEYNDEGWDEVTYLVFKPTPNPEDIEYICYEAWVPIKFHTRPGPSRGDVRTSHDFLSLDMPGLPREIHAKRIADFREEYFRRYSPMALAVNAMVDDMQVSNKVVPLFGRAADKPKPLGLVTQSNLIAAQNGAHKPDLGAGAEYKNNPYDTQFSRCASGIIDDMCRYGEGVLLTRHSDAVLADWDNHFLDLFDMWATLIVNKQVLVEQSYGKPLIVLNDKKHFKYKEIFNGSLDWDDPNVERAFVDFIKNIKPSEDPWLQFIMLTRYLHEKNFVKQEPHFLFTQMSESDPGLIDRMKAMLLEGRKERIDVPEYRPEYFGRDRTDLFEVTVLGSAGTFVGEYLIETERLGYWAASQGMHLRTGGGNFGIMGAASRGVLHYMGENQHNPAGCHLSLIQMPRTLQFEGAAVDPNDIKKESAALGDKANKFMAVERNFDDRMTSLFRSNAFVVEAPGIGTYQELARWIRYKHSGRASHLEGQKIIMVNSPQKGSSKHIRLMDPFLAIVPPHIRENDMEVVPTMADAQELLHKAQKRFDHERMLAAHQAEPTPALRHG